MCMLFRSASLRLGEMLNSPLVESHLNPAKTVIADRLQWARSSIRKRLDMDDSSSAFQDKEEPKLASVSVENSTLLDVGPPTSLETLVNGNQLEKAEKQQEQQSVDTDSSSRSTCASPLRSPERLTLTSGDPLGALDSPVVGAVQMPTTPQVATETVSRKNSSFVVPDPEGRLFINTHPSSSSSSASGNDSSDASSDPTSSSESDTDSEEESDHSHDNIPSSASKLPFRYHIVRMSLISNRFLAVFFIYTNFARFILYCASACLCICMPIISRYAGNRWSLRKPDFRVNLGAQVAQLGNTALNSLRFASLIY